MRDGNREDDKGYKYFMKYVFPWIAVFGMVVYGLVVHPLDSKVHFVNGEKAEQEDKIETIEKNMLDVEDKSNNHIRDKSRHVTLDIHNEFTVLKNNANVVNDKLDVIINQRQQQINQTAELKKLIETLENEE